MNVFIKAQITSGRGQKRLMTRLCPGGETRWPGDEAETFLNIYSFVENVYVTYIKKIDTVKYFRIFKLLENVR